MTEPDRQSTLDAAASLERSMTDLTDEIGRLQASGRRNRRWIFGLACSLVLDALLSVAIFFVAVQARDASSQAAQNRQTAVVSCEASNSVRAASTQLWAYVLDLVQRSPGGNPERVQQIDQFRGYLATTYAPRVCS